MFTSFGSKISVKTLSIVSIVSLARFGLESKGKPFYPEWLRWGGGAVPQTVWDLQILMGPVMRHPSTAARVLRVGLRGEGLWGSVYASRPHGPKCQNSAYPSAFTAYCRSHRANHSGDCPQGKWRSSCSGPDPRNGLCCVVHGGGPRSASAGSIPLSGARRGGA